MSAAARPALTALRRRLADPDEDVRLVAAAAIRRIEGAWGHEWIKMTLPDHRFEIHFPAQPERRDGQGMEETWKLEVRKQGWELDRGEPVQLLGFIVCSVLPPNRVSAQPARFWFDGIQQQILKGGSLVGATAVLTSRDFSFADKFPARDVEFKTKDVGRFRVRLVHTSSAVYMIFAVGTVDFLDGDLVKRFTESFKTWDEPAQEPPTGAERVKDLIQRLQRPEPFDRLFALRALAKLGAEAKNAIPQVEKLANQGTEEERRYTPGTC
jgi:hypothetical protein